MSTVAVVTICIAGSLALAAVVVLALRSSRRYYERANDAARRYELLLGELSGRVGLRLSGCSSYDHPIVGTVLGYPAIAGERGGLSVRLGAGTETSSGDSDSFTKHFTRLVVRPPAGRAFRVPGGRRKLVSARRFEKLATALPSSAAALVPRIATLAGRLELRTDELLLVARPTPGQPRGFWYRFDLLLEPDAIERLIDVGVALGRELIEGEGSGDDPGKTPGTVLG